MLMIVVKNLNSGSSFGGPFYYDISTIVAQAMVLPGLVDWYVSLYSPYHQRTWNEDKERKTIRDNAEKKQREILKDPNYVLGNQLDSLIQKDLEERKASWEIAENLLCLKEKKDWEMVLKFVAKWNGLPGNNLMTRIKDVPSVWTDPVWSKKL